MTELSKDTIKAALKNRMDLINKRIRQIEMHEDEDTTEESTMIEVAVWKNKGNECQIALIELERI